MHSDTTFSMGNGRSVIGAYDIVFSGYVSLLDMYFAVWQLCLRQWAAMVS